ncbi:uncharacterized protein LOC124255153 [Haliotis rubra]|uniref:uncharacterized protein LOC124255153 n=1 Tax=Haliotis rubra TaxID=36100 RepID=UPI001EE5F4BC|nr:uncharacterized protein LOC124255153 [Haliotis rubra]
MAGVWILAVFVVTSACWMQFTVGTCPAGKFGDSCNYSCHCGHSCNKTTGVCGGGCDRGWVGGHRGTCQKENIAYKKRATTSSGIYRSAWSADKAVDGNRDQDVLHNSCYHSVSPPSVWTVDLGQQYRIHDVRIYNRHLYVYLIRSAVLSLSNSSNSTLGVPCYTFPNNTATGNSVYEVICDGRGRYFTITHNTNYLNLCEVEIYVCSQGSFGTDCSHFCHCSDGPCDGVSGICAGDCRPGWRGQNCSIECDQDHYGVNCNDLCGNRNCAADTSSCDRHTGSCDTGCLPGWTAVDCTQECSETYGQNCSKQCSDRNCAEHSPCDHVTGSCVPGCKAGWMRIDCILFVNIVMIILHLFMLKLASPICMVRIVPRPALPDTVRGTHPVTQRGDCDTGCETGWTETDCTACDSQHYGPNCTKNCTSRHCASNSSCNFKGNCDSGCQTGWIESDCTVFQEAVSSDSPVSVATYAGVVGVVLVGLVLVLIFVFIRRRNLSKKKHGDAELVSKAEQSSQDEGNVYMNVGNDGEKQSTASKKKLIQVQPETPPEKEENRPMKQEEEGEPGEKGKEGEPIHEEEKKEDTEEEELEENFDSTTQREEAAEVPDRNYYNLEEAGIGRLIPVSTLQARAREFEETPGLAEDEFKRLPDGFIHPYVESQMPKNSGKNRFKGYYPYDYNRVLLQDGDGGGDYINASYVDGYTKDKRYIAAQGPYNNQVVVDFWRMIWEKECRTVVMVTGLVEAGKVKCLRYWPEKSTKKYGDVMVTMVSDTRLSNYTFTNLSVENAKERKKWDVNHLHFTSWPDHGVPDAAALLDFMWRVKVISGQQTQPIIVHCSAGIGRTGTYIAVENLVEQAKAADVVDVVSFVSNMRGQRKNMIQTKEQYMFVYQAVARAVTDGDTSVDVDVIRQMDLGCVSDITFGNRTVRQHLESLRNVQQGNPESFGVRSVHSYTKSNGFFIMTSHPDKEDVWNQVYNSDSHSLITFAVGDLRYLPSVDHPITTKSFAVSMRRSAALSNGILMNTIDINLLDCDDTTCIQHYHIAGSVRDPNINLMIDSFLTWTSDPQRSSSTIISDSLTDCRLLVLVVNIASRLQDDGRVDVINNMRQLYTRLGGPPYTESPRIIVILSNDWQNIRQFWNTISFTRL